MFHIFPSHCFLLSHYKSYLTTILSYTLTKDFSRFFTMNVSIGMTAPDFTATTTFGPIHMSDYKGSWLVFFSHPGDFTPVCTTEFLAFSEHFNDFTKLSTKLLGLSIDSNTSHLAWVNEIFLITGVQIPFPIVADRSGDIARLYGMIATDVSSTETVRNVYIIDPNQKIRAILIYPLTNGRCIKEILRLVTALQTTDKYGVVTPACWQPGEPVMVPPPKTYDELIARDRDSAAQGLECKDWFWCYKNLPSNSTNNNMNNTTNSNMNNNMNSNMNGNMNNNMNNNTNGNMNNNMNSNMNGNMNNNTNMNNTMQRRK